VERTDTELPGVCLITPKIHSDPRGFFMESYNQRSMAALPALLWPPRFIHATSSGE